MSCRVMSKTCLQHEDVPPAQVCGWCERPDDGLDRRQLYCCAHCAGEARAKSQARYRLNAKRLAAECCKAPRSEEFKQAMRDRAHLRAGRLLLGGQRCYVSMRFDEEEEAWESRLLAALVELGMERRRQRVLDARARQEVTKRTREVRRQQLAERNTKIERQRLVLGYAPDRIARNVGCTRNAVIGHLWRAGLIGKRRRIVIETAIQEGAQT